MLVASAGFVFCLNNENAPSAGYAKHKSGRPPVRDHGLADVEADVCGVYALARTRRRAGSDGPHDTDTARTDGRRRCRLELVALSKNKDL